MKTTLSAWIIACLLLVGSGLSKPLAAGDSRSAAIYADKHAKTLAQLFAANGFKTAIWEEQNLMAVDQTHPDILVIGPETGFPPAARKALSKYLAKKGNLVLLSPAAFDYSPLCAAEMETASSEPVTTHKVRTQIKKQVAGYKSKEIALTPTTIPGQSDAAVELRTPLIGLGDAYIEVPLKPIRDQRRSVICFWAKGDYEVDVLTVKIEDTAGNQWIAFEELGRDWKFYRLPMANFVRLGPDSAGSEGGLDPAQAQTLLFGMDRNVLWSDKAGSFALGTVSTARRASFDAVPTSALRRWRVCLEEFKAAFPEWIVDPFLDAQPLSHPASIALSPNPVYGGKVAPELRGVSFKIAPFEVKAKSRVKSGGDRDFLSEFQRDSVRRIPLLSAKSSNGKNMGTVAEVRIHAGGYFAGAGLALFGLTGQDYSASSPLGELVIASAKYLVDTPRVIEWTPFTLPMNQDPNSLRCEVLIQNPQPRRLEGEISVSTGGRMSGQTKLSLAAGSLQKAVVVLGEVPADFPIPNFDWSIAVSAPGRKDVWNDTASLEAAVINNGRLMMKLRETHRDGRISHHFFADVYGARAMHALGLYLRGNKQAAERNRDILDGLTGEQFIETARSWCDMLAAVQDPDGSLPLGYGESENLRWTADAGSMALGMAQLATWQDDFRKQTYLGVARRYFHWKNGFYISQEKSEALQGIHGPGAQWTKWGTYGLGLMSYDMVTKQKWGERRRAERGPDYVLGIVMGVNGVLAVLENEPGYHEVMLRDAERFVGGNYPASSYFQAEGSFWMYYLLDKPQLRTEYKRVLETSFLPSVVNGDKHDWFSHGGRETLLWLTLAYYFHHIENSPRVRASIVKALWEQGSPSSGYSVSAAAERFAHSSHGSSIAASKYAGGCSAIWFMELLKPGSTLLKGIAVAPLE